MVADIKINLINLLYVITRTVVLFFRSWHYRRLTECHPQVKERNNLHK